MKDEIMERFKDFTKGIRVLFLIHRHREGGATNNSKLRKIVTTNKEEYAEALDALLQEKNQSGLPLRIYASVNDRNIDKAIRNFRFEQLERDYDPDNLRHGFYLDLKNRFIGCLMTPSTRNTPYFLVDIDDLARLEETEKQLEIIGVKTLLKYRTKKGAHLITEPFNPNTLKVESVEINKDGLMLLAF